ncbi:unnamed protein product [Protopolystoma xenopodis]|uniref:Uncharacterized protein n=1 Tax=Protopolystoma xenopodis TaxID=117903 RepID=A0A448XF57_9PLAT|nr:unnamed protein product [Protopolystoma xenopodis]
MAIHVGLSSLSALPYRLLARLHLHAPFCPVQVEPFPIRIWPSSYRNAPNMAYSPTVFLICPPDTVIAASSYPVAGLRQLASVH